MAIFVPIYHKFTPVKMEFYGRKNTDFTAVKSWYI